MTADLPDNCATSLECRDCKGRSFRVSWNWKPVGLGSPEDGAWMLDCISCGSRWLLQPDGLPNPEEIYGAPPALRDHLAAAKANAT